MINQVAEPAVEQALEPIHKQSAYVAVLELLHREHQELDQYKATAMMFDALNGTNDLDKLSYKTLNGALGCLKRAFKADSLMDYILQKQPLEIAPELACMGDLLVAKDELHDDVMFFGMTRQLVFTDNGIQLDKQLARDLIADGLLIRAFRLI